MKTIYHICISIILLAGALFTTTSCEDWLEVKSPTSRATEDFFQTPIQAEQALLGIYNGLLPVPEYILLMSDGRSDDVWTEPAMTSNVTTWISVFLIRAYTLPEQ